MASISETETTLEAGNLHSPVGWSGYFNDHAENIDPTLECSRLNKRKESLLDSETNVRTVTVNYSGGKWFS
jgi:hypothetical protein